MNSLTTGYVLLFQFTTNFLLAIAIIFGAVFSAKLIQRSIEKTNNKFHKLDANLLKIICAGMTYTIYAIAALLILDRFGVNTTSIIALLGTCGLAIGLALRDTLSNIAAGILLLVLRPFKAGDQIECGSISGTVKEIGLFTTILHSSDGLFISIPNSRISNESIKNLTKNGLRRMDLIIQVDHASSIDKGLKVLNEIAKEEKKFLQKPSPQAMIASISETGINLQLRAWTTVDDYWDVYWEQTKNIKDKMEAEGISLARHKPVIYSADLLK